MEQETKKCPYCGEEIMAVAKKCKHCGEWFEPQPEKPEETVAPLVDEQEEQAEKTIGGSIPTYATVFLWVAIVMAFIGAIQTLDIHSSDVRNKKVKVFIEFANFIPDWLATILDGIAVIGLIVLLLKLSKIVGKPKDMLMNILCIAAAALYGIPQICNLLDVEVLSLLAIPMFLLYFPVIFVLGVKLLLSYKKGALRSLGIGMMVWAVPSVLLFIIMIIGLFVYEDLSDFTGILFAGAVIDAAFYYVLGTCMVDACEHPNNNSNNKWLISVVGVIFGFILLFIL